jgi:hypothetical protein
MHEDGAEYEGIDIAEHNQQEIEQILEKMGFNKFSD